MEKPQSQQEEPQEMIEMNIKEFLETTREHLFGLIGQTASFASVQQECRSQ